MSAPPQKKVALLVGAGDYIGAAIARRFAREGHAVCMGRRNGEKLKPLADEIRAAGGEAHAFSLDAREEEQVVERFAHIEREIGPLDVVVFNVGANVSFPIRDTTARVFTKVWQMACLGGFLSGREAARYMLGPEGIHVAHMIIDAGVDTAWVRERIRERLGPDAEPPPDALVDPDSIADAYWFVHGQPRDAWTFEFDLRPAGETW